MANGNTLTKEEINQLSLLDVAQKLLAHPTTKKEKHRLQGYFDNTQLNLDTICPWLLACRATTKGSEAPNTCLNYHRQAFVSRLKKLDPASSADQAIVRHIRRSDVYNNDPIFQEAVKKCLIKFK